MVLYINAESEEDRRRRKIGGAHTTIPIYFHMTKIQLMV
jgi:hypothetical protein